MDRFERAERFIKGTLIQTQQDFDIVFQFNYESFVS